MEGPWINSKCLLDILRLDRFNIIGLANVKASTILTNGIINPTVHADIREIAGEFNQIPLHPDINTEK